MKLCSRIGHQKVRQDDVCCSTVFDNDVQRCSTVIDTVLQQPVQLEGSDSLLTITLEILPSTLSRGVVFFFSPLARPIRTRELSFRPLNRTGSY